jgi:ATP-dependent protease ClpP protease subunit
MTNRAEVRGVIVSSDYDISAFFPYIQRGVITPESYFRKQLGALSVKEDAEIYINSSGGSVFAGNEMINAVRDWQMQSGKSITITVGAMAASMAANMIAVLGNGSNVKVHDNTKIMYHGAWGYNVGGADSQRDYADMLDKINADVKTKLISKFGISEETVNEWFAEGREGWVSSTEAVELGLAGEVIGDNDSLPDRPDNITDMLTERGEKLAAALINNYQPTEENEMKNVMDKVLSLVGLGPEAKEDEVIAALEKVKLEEPQDFKQMHEDVSAQLDIAAEKINELEAENGEIFSAKEALETELTESKSALETVTKEVEAANASLESLNAGLKRDGEEKLENWAQAEAKYGYVDARKKFPELYEEFMEANKENK